MTFNNSRLQASSGLEEGFLSLSTPVIPEILHSTGDVIILTSILTHCVLKRDIYLQTLVRMPAWIFLAIVWSSNLRIRDDRCAVLQELCRLAIIMYYSIKLNFKRFPLLLRSNKESASTQAFKSGYGEISGKPDRNLSEDEVDKFYKGVPTLERGNEPVNYSTLPYDKTLEISHALFTADNNKVYINQHNGISFQGMLNYKSRKIRAWIKTNIRDDIQSLRGLANEVKLLKFVGQHDNLQTIVGACTTDLSRGKLFVVLENCGNHSLTLHLQDLRRETVNLSVNTNNVAEDLLVDFYRWAYEISSGMKFISSKGIVHGMLTCDCILINELGTIKLTDYGTAPHLLNSERFQPEHWDHDGWKYLAPEAMIKNSFTTSGDVWSFGVVLWRIFTIYSDPYPSFDKYSKIFSLSLIDGMRPEAQAGIPPVIFDLLGKCWMHDPEKRPTFDMCCQYTYAKTKPKRRIVTCDGDFIT